MGQLNQRLQLRMLRNPFAIAQRPMIAAARAGTRGTHQSPPYDDQKVVTQKNPGNTCVLYLRDQAPLKYHNGMTTPYHVRTTALASDQHAFLFLLFALMLFESGRLFWPFAGAIGSAIVVAIVFRPWHDALGRRFPKLSPVWRALLLDFIVVILFVIPVIALIWAAVSEIQDLYPALVQRVAQAGDWLHQNPQDQSFPWLIEKLPASLTNQLNIHSEQVKTRLTEAGQRAVTVLADVGTAAAQRLLDGALDIAILFVFCLFFMFRDGKTTARPIPGADSAYPRNQKRA